MIALSLLFPLLLATAYGFRSFRPSSSCSIKLTALRARPWYDIYGRLDDVENDVKEIRNSLQERANDFKKIRNCPHKISSDLKEIKTEPNQSKVSLDYYNIAYNALFIISQIFVWYYTLLKYK